MNKHILCKISAVIVTAALIMTGCNGEKDSSYETYDLNGTSGYDTSAQGDTAGLDEGSFGSDTTYDDPGDYDGYGEGNGGAGATDISNIDTSAYSGTFFTWQTVTDPNRGYPVADVIVPEGWSVNCLTDWNMIDMINPAMARIILTSGDGRAMIQYDTTRDFADEENNVANIASEKHPEGPDEGRYATFLEYKNAVDYAEYYIANTISQSYSMTGDGSMDESALSEVDDYWQQTCVLENQQTQQLLRGSDITLDWTETSGSKRQFSYTGNDGGNYVGETETVVLGRQTTTHLPGSSHVAGSKIINCYWFPVYVATYTAYDDQAFNEYYDAYRAILDNMQIRQEFLSARNEYSNELVENYFRIMAEQSGQTFDPSQLDTWSSDSETMDRVREMWDDAIKDQTQYQTEDGGYVKVPTQYDAVYQNGDTLYLGTDGGAPDGWTKLYEGY